MISSTPTKLQPVVVNINDRPLITNLRTLIMKLRLVNDNDNDRATDIRTLIMNLLSLVNVNKITTTQARAASAAAEAEAEAAPLFGNLGGFFLNVWCRYLFDLFCV